MTAPIAAGRLRATPPKLIGQRCPYRRRLLHEKARVQPGFTWGDPPTMAGVNLGEVQMFLEQGTPNPEGCSVYFVVGDADELYEFHRTNGVEVTAPPEDRPYGLRDYTVRDCPGTLTFGHRLPDAWAATHD